jgi:hypothetical protein
MRYNPGILAAGLIKIPANVKIIRIKRQKMRHHLSPRLFKSSASFVSFGSIRAYSNLPVEIMAKIPVILRKTENSPNCTGE